MAASFFRLTLRMNAWLNHLAETKPPNQMNHAMKMNQTTRLTLGIAATVAFLVAGCDTLEPAKTQHYATSLYAYLYSDQKNHVDAPAVPVLSLPLRVGVAFVPADTGSRRNNAFFSTDEVAVPETQKMALMKQISAQFKAYPFVKSIELIPTAYLTPRGGFANLEQIRTMYNVDVMALLSYDQVQFTGEGVLSLSYWTVVGIYVIPGEKNETKIMLDAAVYDIASHKLLFRAPGIGEVKAYATPINLSEQLRKNSESGFEQAATNLTANLKIQLADFKERVTNSPADYRIEHKPGYTGAGSFGGPGTILVAGLGACFLWTHQNRKQRKP
jgi:rhombotail lipoprotein